MYGVLPSAQRPMRDYQITRTDAGRRSRDGPFAANNERRCQQTRPATGNLGIITCSAAPLIDASPTFPAATDPSDHKSARPACQKRAADRGRARGRRHAPRPLSQHRTGRLRDARPDRHRTLSVQPSGRPEDHGHQRRGSSPFSSSKSPITPVLRRSGQFSLNVSPKTRMRAAATSRPLASIAFTNRAAHHVPIRSFKRRPARITSGSWPASRALCVR